MSQNFVLYIFRKFVKLRFKFIAYLDDPVNLYHIMVCSTYGVKYIVRLLFSDFIKKNSTDKTTIDWKRVFDCLRCPLSAFCLQSSCILIS